jgi:hypothetical protein
LRLNNLFGRIFLVFLLSGLVYSCDNTLEPVDYDTGIYSIFSALDLNRAPNYVRVRDLNVPFTSEATEQIDARVLFENIDTGLQKFLDFQLLTESGVTHHNYIVPDSIEPNTNYRVTVTRSDGENISVKTLTPTKPDPIAEPLNEKCYTPVTITFDPVYESTIEFYIEFQAGGFKTRLGPYVIRKNSESDSRAQFTFMPVDLTKMAFGSSGQSRCSDLIRPYFEFYFTHYAEGFYEELNASSFDAFESTQRFGSFYRDTLIVPVDTSRVCPPDCIRAKP